MGNVPRASPCVRVDEGRRPGRLQSAQHGDLAAPAQKRASTHRAGDGGGAAARQALDTCSQLPVILTLNRVTKKKKSSLYFLSLFHFIFLVTGCFVFPENIGPYQTDV